MRALAVCAVLVALAAAALRWIAVPATEERCDDRGYSECTELILPVFGVIGLLATFAVLVLAMLIVGGRRAWRKHAR